MVSQIADGFTETSWIPDGPAAHKPLGGSGVIEGEEKLIMRGIILAALFAMTAAQAEQKNVTWTGWFSDLKCATSRAASGTFTATNPDCARTCIESGAAPAFISEQARGVFTVKDSASIIDQLGFHVEVEATVDAAAHTIVIQKIKQLGFDGAACARPRKK